MKYNIEEMPLNKNLYNKETPINVPLIKEIVKTIKEV